MKVKSSTVTEENPGTVEHALNATFFEWSPVIYGHFIVRTYISCFLVAKLYNMVHSHLSGKFYGHRPHIVSGQMGSFGGKGEVRPMCWVSVGTGNFKGGA